MARGGRDFLHYDSYVFVEQIKSRHWLQMLAAVDRALDTVRRYPAVHKRPGLFHPGDDAKYLAFLLATREYLLADGRLRPLGIDNSMLLLLKPLCEGLVAKGRFPPERLDLFSELDISQVGILTDMKDALRKDRG
jgi:hypothetical protein